MKSAGEEPEMKMLADAGMMLEKGHEILFLLRVRSSANWMRSGGPSGLPVSSSVSSLSVSNLLKN
jgi:hypothetical protein